MLSERQKGRTLKSAQCKGRKEVCFVKKKLCDDMWCVCTVLCASNDGKNECSLVA